MSSRPTMGPWVMGSPGRQEPQSQLLPTPHSISDSLELGVSPCWNRHSLLNRTGKDSLPNPCLASLWPEGTSKPPPIAGTGLASPYRA